MKATVKNVGSEMIQVHAKAGPRDIDIGLTLPMASFTLSQIAAMEGNANLSVLRGASEKDDGAEQKKLVRPREDSDRVIEELEAKLAKKDAILDKFIDVSNRLGAAKPEDLFTKLGDMPTQFGLLRDANIDLEIDKQNLDGVLFGLAVDLGIVKDRSAIKPGEELVFSPDDEGAVDLAVEVPKALKLLLEKQAEIAADILAVSEVINVPDGQTVGQAILALVEENAALKASSEKNAAAKTKTDKK